MRVTVVGATEAEKPLTVADLNYGDIGVAANGRQMFMKIWMRNDVHMVVDLTSGGSGTYETGHATMPLKEILKQGSGREVLLKL